jgi:hypothetical protein
MIATKFVSLLQGLGVICALDIVATHDSTGVIKAKEPVIRHDGAPLQLTISSRLFLLDDEVAMSASGQFGGITCVSAFIVTSCAGAGLTFITKSSNNHP